MKIYVGNLHESTNEGGLENLFSAVGDIVSIVVIKDKISGGSKGFGFVEFESRKTGHTAISRFDGHNLCGVKIKVNTAKAKPNQRHQSRW